MSRALPPLDVHAHIDPQVEPRALESLGAVIFAATRSSEEFESTRSRSDALTVWGVGCHPGVPEAQAAFNEARFAELLAETAFVSEVGLDGGSSVPMDRQTEVFASVLRQLANSPRLISVHSRRATKPTVDLIEQSGARGVILHWWLGSDAETRRADDLGCLFSVNRRMDVALLRKSGVRLASLLPETDHPSGDRGGSPRQPGWTLDVEQCIATEYETTPALVRAQFWYTLQAKVHDLDVQNLLPPVLQAMITHARDTQ